MDYTYNINKFNMPLFTIIKRTLIDQFFTIRMAFLIGETFNDFHWVYINFNNYINTFSL